MMLNPTSPPMLDTVLHLLDEDQATDVAHIDVHAQTTVTDYMVVCSGRSSRHVKAIAEHVREKMKAAGYPILGESGGQSAEWILLDFGDVILHVMQPSAREFYYLEGLWQS